MNTKNIFLLINVMLWTNVVIPGSISQNSQNNYNLAFVEFDKKLISKKSYNAATTTVAQSAKNVFNQRDRLAVGSAREKKNPGTLAIALSLKTPEALAIGLLLSKGTIGTTAPHFLGADGLTKSASGKYSFNTKNMELAIQNAPLQLPANLNQITNSSNKISTPVIKVATPINPIPTITYKIYDNETQNDLNNLNTYNDYESYDDYNYYNDYEQENNTELIDSPTNLDATSTAETEKSKIIPDQKNTTKPAHLLANLETISTQNATTKAKMDQLATDAASLQQEQELQAQKLSYDKMVPAAQANATAKAKIDQLDGLAAALQSQQAQDAQKLSYDKMVPAAQANATAKAKIDQLDVSAIALQNQQTLAETKSFDTILAAGQANATAKAKIDQLGAHTAILEEQQAQNNQKLSYDAMVPSGQANATAKSKIDQLAVGTTNAQAEQSQNNQKLSYDAMIPSGQTNANAKAKAEHLG